MGLMIKSCNINLIQEAFNDNNDCVAVHSTVLSSESWECVFKSTGLLSYCPPVNTSDIKQMNGQRGSRESWGWRVRFLDQCTLIGQQINQSSPWGALESNCERLKCFVWVNPLAWPCWLTVSQTPCFIYSNYKHYTVGPT